MSFALVIRIIGGVCGGAIGRYLSDKIYNSIYYRPDLRIQLNEPDNYESKIKDAKSFEEILNIQIQQYIDNCDKYNYDYDNEHGNIFEIVNY